MQNAEIRESHGRFTFVKPRMTDYDLQGILNSKQYLDLVTEARIEQMTRYYKFPMEVYIEKKQSWILSRFAIEYRKPIPFPSQFFVHTKVKTIEGPKANVEFSFVSLDKSKTYASGEVDYYLFDMTSRKPVVVPENERKVFLEEGAPEN
ncbi:MAG: thioesterase family protein [Deltaproteobacteria bacterium]|nr:thioesterase family protein [Deltaproteobacteria bacterium]